MILDQNGVELRTVDNIFGTTTNPNGEAINIATVYAVVKLLANTIASTKLNYIDKKEDILPNPLKRKITGTQINFFTSLLYDYLLHGNGYALILPNEILYLEQSKVQIYITETAGAPFYYQISNYGKSFRVWPENIIHIKNMSSDGYVGLSPITTQLNTFNAALAMSEYQSKFVDNSAQISGVITTEKKLHKDTVVALRENFSDNFSGSTNAGKIPVLSEGMKFNQLNRLSPLDMDYLNSVKLSKADICEIFNVPLTMLGTSDQSYNNSETHALLFQNYTLAPILTQISQEFTLKLAIGSNEYKHEINSIILSSAKDKSDSLSLLKNTGIITANEARNYYSLPSMEGGDELVSPENEVGDEVQVAKNTKDTNPTPEKVAPPSKRSLEDIDKEIQKLRSEKGRLTNP